MVIFAVQRVEVGLKTLPISEVHKTSGCLVSGSPETNAVREMKYNVYHPYVTSIRCDCDWVV